MDILAHNGMTAHIHTHENEMLEDCLSTKVRPLKIFWHIGLNTQRSVQNYVNI